MIITVTFNPAIDKTACVRELIVGGLNRLSDVRQDAGGKGINVSKTLKALQTDSLATGFLAGSAGQIILDLLEARRIPTDFIPVPGQTRTNLKVLNQAMELTELNEPGPCVDADAIRTLIQTISNHAARALESQDECYVVLSGNTGPGVPDTIYRTMIEQFRAAGIRTILDADGALFRQAVEAHPYAMKPNRYELAQYYGLAEDDLNPETIVDLARRFLSDQTRLVAVSMGIDGSIFITRDQVLRVPALTIDYRSAVGAGDAMVAAIADALQKGMSLEKTARYATAVSAGACLSAGTEPADLETVQSLLEQTVIEDLPDCAL